MYLLMDGSGIPSILMVMPHRYSQNIHNTKIKDIKYITFCVVYTCYTCHSCLHCTTRVKDI